MGIFCCYQVEQYLKNCENGEFPYSTKYGTNSSIVNERYFNWGNDLRYDTTFFLFICGHNQNSLFPKKKKKKDKRRGREKKQVYTYHHIEY